MKELGHCGASAMAQEIHPLDLRGACNVASSMSHDGDVDGAAELIEQALTDGHRHGGNRSDAGFYMLLGMRQAFDSVIGHREHIRWQRSADRSVAALRRSLRLA